MSDVPDYMKHTGVISGWGLLYIFLAATSAYCIAASGDVFLIIPRLIKAFNKDDPSKVKGLVYTIAAIVILFPLWGLLPLLSFFVWCAATDYEGASMWFVASLGFFALLSFLTLKDSGWMPLPVLFYYMVFTCFSFFFFIVTQLGMYDDYSYTISGTMSVAVSSIPLIYIALVSGQLAQSRAMKTHHIEGIDTVIYESCIKPTKVTRGFEEHIDKFFEYMENVPLPYLYSGLYILSIFPIFVFAIDAIVSGKTGAGLIAMVNIMIIELTGATLYIDTNTPLANVYKLALLSLGTRFIILSTPPGAWLITNFTMLCFASQLYWIRFLEVVVPHPGCKMKFADSVMRIFKRREILDKVQAAELAAVNHEDEGILDSSGIEMSFLDELETEVQVPSKDRLEGEVAKTHTPPTPYGIPNSGLSVVILQLFCMINLLLGASNTHGVIPEDLIIECKRCNHDIGQYSLCGFVWAFSFFTMSLYSTRHLYLQYQQGGHNQRIRQTLLYTVQTMLLSGHESFEVFQHQMDKVAHYFIPEVKGHHALGFMILLTYIQAIVMSIVAGWLFNLWFLVPCTTLMPIANYIIYRFIKMWEKSGCKHVLLWEQYTSDGKSDVKPASGNDEEDLGQTVALAEMSGSVSCKCTGGWKGNILTVDKVECGWIGIDSSLSGISQASFAAQWSDTTLKVVGVTSGHVCVGQKIISELVPKGTVIVSEKGGGVFIVNQSMGEQNIDVNLKTQGASIEEGTTIINMLSGINKGKAGRYEMSTAPAADACGQKVEISAESKAEFIAQIDGTTMTVQEITQGHLCVGMEISCVGVIKGTTIKNLGTATNENQIGTYIVETPCAQRPFISFKILSPFKERLIENWMFAVFLHFVAVMLSIPSERNEVPWLLCTLTFSIFLTYAAFIRWKVKLRADYIQMYWLLSAWFPIFLFASTAPAFDIDDFLIIFFFFGGIGLQLFSFAMLMMSDCNQSAFKKEMLDANMTIIRGLIGASLCLGIIVVSTLMALHSVSAGACLLMISVVPFTIVLIRYQIIPITIYRSRLQILLAFYIILAILCGMTGALLNPTYSFYWASFTWATLGIVFLGIGINYDMYGPERVYSYYFFPIYQLSHDGRRLQDATFEGSAVLVFLLMLAVWSLWCAVCVDPYPSVIIFVLTFEFIIVYVLVKSRNFDDFSKLLGLDYTSLVAAAEYSIRYHACELHELPHDLLDALHIPDDEDATDNKNNEQDKCTQSLQKNDSKPGEKHYLEYDVEGIMPPSLSPFETIKNIISLKNERYTQYILREPFDYPASPEEMDKKVNDVINLFDGMVMMNAVLGRVFSMYRLKALVVAESNRRLMEAEILSFIRTNVPDMDHVKPHHIEQIADIEMVNILLSWKDWKERRENAREKFLRAAHKLAEQAEKRRRVQMVQQLLNSYKESNEGETRDHPKTDELLGLCGEQTRTSITELKKQIKQQGGRYKDDSFPVDGGRRLLDLNTDFAVHLNLLDEYCLPQTGASIEDIFLGQTTNIANSYLLSALAIIVEKKPKLLLKMFDTESDPSQSIYAIKLYYNGALHTVAVDDSFLFLPKGVQNISKKLWVMLLVKAYAKLHGSYEAIEAGFESTALADLTGGIPDVLIDLSFNLEKTWGSLSALHSADHLMLAAGGAVDDKGFVNIDESITGDHAFPILDVRVVDGHRVVKIRNLWGREQETFCRWGRDSIEWTPRFKNLLDFQDENDGTLWVDFDDFCHTFKRVYSCRLFCDRESSGTASSWSVETAGGCMKYVGSFANNPHFLLRGAGVVTIVLSQDEVTKDEKKGKGVVVTDTAAAGIYALRTGGYPLLPGTLPSFNQLVDKTSFVSERDVILELADVQPGVTYTIIPTTYEPGIVRSFTLKAYGKNHVELTQLESKKDSVKMKPIAINSNSPIAKNSRTKPRSPTNSFKDEYSTINDDIEANNTGIKTITSTTAGATSSSSSNFVEVDLSDHEMEGGPVGSGSIGGDVDYDTDEGGSGSEDQYV